MSEFVLVTGATGQQGGAVARALVAAGTPVHALVRDPDSPRARALTDLGVELVRGDLDEPESLKPALDGARGLFSIQNPDFTDLAGDTEIVRARALAAAAAAADVPQIVHTSASGATRLIDEERWGPFVRHAFRVKALTEDALREAGAASTTILRPSAFLENFLAPSYFYAPGSSEKLLVGYDVDVPQAFVAVSDIGAAAAAAFADPDRFDAVELELASERISLREAAATLSRVWKRPLTLPESRDAAIADGLAEVFQQSQGYLSAHPAPAFPEYQRVFGLEPTSLEEWAHRVA
ncbi:NmrA family NAD(P)-binding protein [Pseudonocardia benzenivorans]|uniref:NmrA family protein n=2 Tax=Pseudonocardia TaxID=1847 RepID=F4CVS3_PSEUX|nr:NmrA family NAD(P)-binding protein [Pseudonocardia dioxanivorans]AEA25408.1 NmrA family protein [Pseudonocardia dioxanivorans CB1190]GJF02378.1 nucleotide-diphosphate-sugar epimerase [Pseudonocardia sp. D17]